MKSDGESNYKQIFENSEVSSKYVQLIPFFLEKVFFILIYIKIINYKKLILKHKKHFVIKMELLPKSESLKMTCLSNSGVHTKYVELESLIPVIEADYREITANKLSYPPPFIDNDMIYFNTCLNEFYVFDRDSVWNEEGVQNPLLDLSKRFNEKKWLDYLRTD